jgi:hypothetical protein
MTLWKQIKWRFSFWSCCIYVIIRIAQLTHHVSLLQLILITQHFLHYDSTGTKHMHQARSYSLAVVAKFWRSESGVVILQFNFIITKLNFTLTCCRWHRRCAMAIKLLRYTSMNCRGSDGALELGSRRAWGWQELTTAYFDDVKERVQEETKGAVE